MVIVLIFLSLIPTSLFSFYVYYGGLKKVTFRIERQGGELLVYRQMKGNYAKSERFMDEVSFSLLKKHNVRSYQSFGIYYDDPRKVEREHWNSDIGCIIEDRHDLDLSLLSKEFKVKKNPVKLCAVTEIPYKGRFSVFIAIINVFPYFDQFIKKKGYKKTDIIMQIYDIPNRKIIYRKEIVEENLI